MPVTANGWGAVAGAFALALALSVAACTPTVRLAPPEEPITINLNVKVQHDIRVKVDKELEEVFSKESPLF